MKDAGYIYSADLGHDVRLINHEFADSTSRWAYVYVYYDGSKTEEEELWKIKEKLRAICNVMGIEIYRRLKRKLKSILLVWGKKAVRAKRSLHLCILRWQEKNKNENNNGD